MAGFPSSEIIISKELENKRGSYVVMIRIALERIFLSVDVEIHIPSRVRNGVWPSNIWCHHHLLASFCRATWIAWRELAKPWLEAEWFGKAYCAGAIDFNSNVPTTPFSGELILTS
jgi:hypothetical protein